MKPNTRYNQSSRPFRGGRGGYHNNSNHQTNNRKRPGDEISISGPSKSPKKNFRGNFRGRGKSYFKPKPNPNTLDEKTEETPVVGIPTLVVPQKYPLETMTPEQLDSLQNKLLDALDNIEVGAFRPQFLENTKQKGTLRINCNNQESVEWLKNTVSNITPWEGAQLKAMEPETVTKMTIIPKGYPLEVMSFEQLETLQSEILKIIDTIQEDLFMPQFLNSFKNRGSLVLDCNNKESADWLVQTIKNLDSWEGPELSVLEPKDVPVRTMLQLTVPADPEDPIQLLERLDRQNKGLKAKEWHLVKSRKDASGQLNIFVCVEDSAIDTLRNSEYSLFLNFGKTKVKNLGRFRPRVKRDFKKDEHDSTAEEGSTKVTEAASEDTNTLKGEILEDTVIKTENEGEDTIIKTDNEEEDTIKTENGDAQ